MRVPRETLGVMERSEPRKPLMSEPSDGKEEPEPVVTPEPEPAASAVSGSKSVSKAPVDDVKPGHGGYMVKVGDVYKIKWSKTPIEDAFIYCRLPEDHSLAKHKYKTMDVLESPHRGPKRYYTSLVYFLKVAHTFKAPISIMSAAKAPEALPLFLIGHQIDNELTVMDRDAIKEVDLRVFDWVAACSSRGPYVLKTMALGDCAANLNKVPNSDSVSLSPY